MARDNGPIKVWNRGDTVPLDSDGGYAGGDSTAAAIRQASDAANAAQQTIQNLQGAATTLPPGSAATVNVSGTGTSKVITVGVPRGADGAPGMGYAEGQQLLADSAATTTAAQQAAATSQAAAALVGAPPAAVAEAAIRRYMLSPLDLAYGAVGDGVADDTAPLQAAINAVAAARVPLDLSRLTYRVTAGLTLPAGLTLRNGSIATTMATTGETGVLTVAGSDVTLEDINLDAGPSAKFGLIVDQPYARLRVTRGAWTGSASHAVCVQDKATDVTITDVTSSGVKSAVRIRGACKRVTVDGLKLTGWLTYGVEVRGVSGVGAPEDVTIRRVRSSDPTSGECGAGGVARQTIATFGASDARTKGLTVEDVVAIGPGVAWVTGVVNTATGDQIGVQYVDNLRMTKIVSLDGGENGISVSRQVYGATLTNLHVSGADGYGLQVGRAGDTTTDVTVTGGVFTDNGKNRASERATNVLAGVFLQDVNRVTVTGVRSGNVTGTSQAWGISTATVTGATITGNDLSGNTSGRTQFSATTFDMLQDGDTTRFGTGAGATTHYLNGADASRRALIYQAAGVDQWRWVQNSANHMTVERVSGGTATNVLQIDYATGQVWVRQEFRASGKVGFNGKVPITPPTLAAGATAADIRQALIDLGLCQ